MGLIGDRKAKKQREKEKEIEKLKVAQSKAHSGLKGVGGGKMVVARYPTTHPAGYYTTPAHHSPSWTQQSHPGQPRHQQNVNPRYQTWVAPRKQQPHLGQLVRNLSRNVQLTTDRTHSNINKNTAIINVRHSSEIATY